jgi:hypothetical protein
MSCPRIWHFVMYCFQLQGRNLENIYRNFSQSVLFCNNKYVATRNTDTLVLRKFSLTIWHRSFKFNSNKSSTWCNNFSLYYPDVCLQLNIFRAFSRSSSGAQLLQCQSLVFTSYRGDSRAVFLVGPTGRSAQPRTAARLSTRCEGKTRDCHCSYWAPYDGRENARNMLSCKQTSG